MPSYSPVSLSEIEQTVYQLTVFLLNATLVVCLKKEEMDGFHGGLWYFSCIFQSCPYYLISSGSDLAWCSHCVIYIMGTTFIPRVVPFLCYKSQFPLKMMTLFSQDCLCTAELVALKSFPLDFLSGRVQHGYISLEVLLGAPKTFLWCFL